jgi:hypothetical protein
MALIPVLLGCGASTTLEGNAPLSSTPTTMPSSAISTHEVARSATLVSGDSGPVVATCPQGELALSGGWSVPSTRTHVYAAKVLGNGWAVWVQTPPPTNANATGTPPSAGPQGGTAVTAYVECLRGATGTTVTQREVTQSIPATIPSHTVDEAGAFIGTCQQGEGLVGFGFDLGAANANSLELEASVPSEVLHVISWSFKVWNHDTVAHDVTFDVQCLTTTLHGALSFPGQKGTVLYATMSGDATAVCPDGTMLAGGGFRYTLAGARGSFVGSEYHHSATSATPNGWQSSLYAITSYGLEAIAPEAIAVCLSLT